jgi:hypothetical protein
MNQPSITQAKNPDLHHSMAALQRAAIEARKIAIQTNTAIIVMQDGKLVRMTAEELRRQSAESLNQEGSA